MTDPLSLEPARRAAARDMGAGERPKQLDTAARRAAREAINLRVGSRLRALRSDRRETQFALGEALGLTNQQVQKYEKGVNGMNLERLWLAACYFGVDIEVLLDGIEEAALATTGRDAAPSPERLEHRQLRLQVAQALTCANSPKLLRSMLQLLRASEADRGDLDE
jgi:transcriptional regulator with XRE-family HTH domain